MSGCLQHSREHATNIDSSNVCAVEKARSSVVTTTCALGGKAAATDEPRL